MRYSNIIGVIAGIVLIIACFMPWTYYPDLQQYFTGFYSNQNFYGKPGKLFMILLVPAIVFFLLPRIWAKRANWIIVGLMVAYAVKTYMLFTSCYNGICPVKQPGIYIMMASVFVMMISAVLPYGKLKEK